jgi:hypothetical protein
MLMASNATPRKHPITRNSVFSFRLLRAKNRWVLFFELISFMVLNTRLMAQIKHRAAARILT